MSGRPNRDPYVLSLAEAGELMGVTDDTVRQQLRDDPSFVAAVAVRVGGRLRVSRVRLERYLHGEVISPLPARPRSSSRAS